MKLRKACKQAKKHGLGIARKEWGQQSRILILTNTDYCVMIIPFEEKHKAIYRWEPKLDDLIATDWYLVY